MSGLCPMSNVRSSSRSSMWYGISSIGSPCAHSLGQYRTSHMAEHMSYRTSHTERGGTGYVRTGHCTRGSSMGNGVLSP
eukprot:3941477-Rhodomonas_salina.1